jgi:hypothetical protein
MKDSFARGVVGSVGVPLRSYFKIFWKEEVKGYFNVRFFIFVYFSYVYLMDGNYRYKYARIIFEEWEVFSNKKTLGMR